MRRKNQESKQLRLDLPEPPEVQSLREETRRLRSENERLQTQNTALTQELERLKQVVVQHSANTYLNVGQNKTSLAGNHIQSIHPRLPSTSVTKRSSIDDKIALFRSYFRARDDVYAIRGKEREGRAPYYPQRQYTRNETGEVIYEPLPLTDDVVRAHLQDEQSPVTVGIYPLLLDETCWFLAIDLDKSSWQKDAFAFLTVCDMLNVPAALERSRSGNGCHIWIFFAKPISARIARKLGATLLTRTLEKRHQVGLDSYDRMFPNQDTLPKQKKLGNLIALPLQRLAGKDGNSLFIDRDGDPYPDQWVYLSSIRKITDSEVTAIVREAELSGTITGISGPSAGKESRDEPWTQLFNESPDVFPGTSPAQLKIVLANMIYIQKSRLDSPQINFLRRLAAFQNPEFYKAQAMRLSTYRKPRIIDCSEETSEYIALPRGCEDELMALLDEQGTDVVLEDKRNAGSKIDVTFQGKLREEQRQAAQILSDYATGILSATTAFGKTVIGAWIIAARSTNTLILVDKKQLLEQWRQKLAAFLNISTDDIGQIGGGKVKKTGSIDVALIQSVYTNHKVKELITDYGHIIVDECHHISAVSFEEVLKHATAKYILGLTATLTRKDGKHPIVLMQCGPVRYKVDAKSQAMKHPFTHVVLPRYTNFKLDRLSVDVSSADGPSGASADSCNLGIQQVYEYLIGDESRNNMIFDDLLQALDQGRSPILLTDRTYHLEYFEERLKGFAKNIIVLRGGMGKKQWQAVQEKIRSVPADEERVILATGRFVGEGFDDERLDTLFLVMPISWKGTLQQYAGRLHRLYDLKREVQIYDYIDEQVPMLWRMYQKRLKGYRAMGYTVRTSDPETIVYSPPEKT